MRGPRVTIMIDARGVHRSARVPWLQSCPSPTKNELLSSGIPVTPRFGGVAGATRAEPAIPTNTPAKSVDRPRVFTALMLPSGGETWRSIAILMFLLASVLLFALAVLEPLYAVGRFRIVRALNAHRGQIAFSGAAFLAAAAMLILVSRF
jgi:hypothetical protein